MHLVLEEALLDRTLRVVLADRKLAATAIADTPLLWLARGQVVATEVHLGHVEVLPAACAHSSAEKFGDYHVFVLLQVYHQVVGELAQLHYDRLVEITGVAVQEETGFCVHFAEFLG